MEAEDQDPSRYFNLSEGNLSHNDHFNSIFLQNPRDDNDEDFHVHDHYHHHHHHHQASVVMDQEKRLRRMVCNRESARRLRMRKRKQIEEMQMQVEQVMASKHYLSNTVISLLENNRQILQENSRLQEMVSYFHQYFMENRMILPGNINDCDINRQSPHQPNLVNW